ncbi:uncharacterized protein LACBIDRAFT_334275 [Laccaria bicolor S238N-H82]|uniref:Predicted protein n=1 Tax=Laccaria bicolor (strain S238N-H82 / ATCC MYA-4686) TaxID=486041 RepID=B0DYP8_LACBS|nr:uncharacterized protein LACBIDRAFT_334275 [Laccaria bicolor S238N-H82]EDR00283.1 predicted protein [Laccaria bicolor S238N-H82]|eukprot:XP_001889035.1 predicted protein [Laccaria bicolor S238N-H82]
MPSTCRRLTHTSTCEGVDPSSTYASTGHFREGEKCNGNGEGFFWSVDVSPPSASPPRFADLLARYSKARSRCQNAREWILLAITVFENSCLPCDRKRPLSARQDSPRPPQHAYCLVNSINPFGRDA